MKTCFVWGPISPNCHYPQIAFFSKFFCAIENLSPSTADTPPLIHLDVKVDALIFPLSIIFFLFLRRLYSESNQIIKFPNSDKLFPACIEFRQSMSRSSNLHVWKIESKIQNTKNKKKNISKSKVLSNEKLGERWEKHVFLSRYCVKISKT